MIHSLLDSLFPYYISSCHNFLTDNNFHWNNNKLKYIIREKNFINGTTRKSGVSTKHFKHVETCVSIYDNNNVLRNLNLYYRSSIPEMIHQLHVKKINMAINSIMMSLPIVVYSWSNPCSLILLPLSNSLGFPHTLSKIKNKKSYA